MWIGWQFFLFAGGLAALLWGAERLIDAASRLAARLGVHPLIIGITILSVGTSLPEIATSITSFVTGHADIAMGNIIGSELVQITLILGLVAFIRPLKGNRKEILFYGGAMILAVILAFFAVYDNYISRLEGALLVAFYIVFLCYVVKKDKEKIAKKPDMKYKSIYPIIFFLVIGTGLTILGSTLLVRSTVNIANWMGISEYIISVFLVGLGTSLPELFVSGMAAWKKDYSMSVGNLLGSNITDPTFSFGIGALFVSKSPINPVASFSIVYLMIVFAIVLGLFYWRKKVGRWSAVLILLLYATSFWVL